MWSISYNINGYPFVFNSKGTYWNGDGVVVNPDSAQFDNPDWIEALKFACQVYPYVAAIEDLDEWVSSWFSYPRETNWSFIAEKLSLLEGNPYDITPSKELLEKIERLQHLSSAAKKPPKRNKKDPGYVYLVQSPTSAYKIGKTVDPDNRIKTFTVKLPFEVDYVCLIETDRMSALETELHAMFEHKRVNGEWFDLDETDVEYIKSLAVAS